MKLSYKAVSRDGRVFRGVIEAKDVREAGLYLRTKDLLPTAINPQKESEMLKFLPFLKRTNSSDVVFLTRQLSSMLSSGLTLMESLRILKEQVQKEALADVLNGVVIEVEEGKPFSVAISKYKEVFSPIYISLVKAAEESGLLDKVLLRLADNLEKQQKIKGSIKSALMYPMIVIIGMILVVVIMMIVVIPQLSVLYENLDIELPLPTRIIMGLSGFFTTFWPLLLVSTFFLMGFYRRWSKTESGRLLIDDTVLKLPVFGQLI